MALLLGTSFKYLTAAVDTLIIFQEAHFSVRDDIINLHGWLIAIFAIAFDKYFVEKFLIKYGNAFFRFEIR